VERILGEGVATFRIKVALCTALTGSLGDGAQQGGVWKLASLSFTRLLTPQ
jgi:hypothetical protein